MNDPLVGYSRNCFAVRSVGAHPPPPPRTLNAAIVELPREVAVACCSAPAVTACISSKNSAHKRNRAEQLCTVAVTACCSAPTRCCQASLLCTWSPCSATQETPGDTFLGYHQPSKRDQTAPFNPLGVYHKWSDSGERQHKSRT